MKETMGQIIRRLRKEQNLTQEELAELLNISAQAVSKWENGTAMPDISQVVPLANLFGVPTDVLFGVYGVSHKEDVENLLAEIYRITDNCNDGEEGPTALVILDKYREAMRLYPNDDNILTEAMAFANMVLDNNRAELCELIGDSGIRSLENEIVRWAGLVIKHSSSINQLLSAKERLIEVYLRQKNYEAALEVVKDFPRYIWNMQQSLKARVLYEAGRREEELETRGWYVSELLHEFSNQVFMIENVYISQEKYEDALYCCEFMRSLLDALYREETYRPPFIYDYHSLFKSHAVCLVKLGRNDEAVEILKDSVEFIRAQKKDFNKKKELDIPLFRNVEFGYGFEGNAVFEHADKKIQNLVTDDVFTPLRDLPAYQVILEFVNENN